MWATKGEKKKGKKGRVGGEYHSSGSPIGENKGKVSRQQINCSGMDNGEV